MTIQQAIDLIGPASLTSEQPQSWADLGCGSGIFTTALAHLLSPGSIVYGVDTHPIVQQQDVSAPGSTNKPVSIIPVEADFIKDPLDLPALDGILMANSLHYVKDKPALIRKLRPQMRPGGPFLIVEYDTDVPVSTWVPYPIAYHSLARLFSDHEIQKLGQRPSTYGRSNMYAALIKCISSH
jgi:SAM-dependent methyltransferase